MLQYIIVQCDQYKHRPWQRIMKTIEGMSLCMYYTFGHKERKGSKLFHKWTITGFLANKHQEELEEWKNVQCVSRNCDIIYTTLTLAHECFVNLDCGVRQKNYIVCSCWSIKKGTCHVSSSIIDRYQVLLLKIF